MIELSNTYGDDENYRYFCNSKGTHLYGTKYKFVSSAIKSMIIIDYVTNNNMKCIVIVPNES